MKQKCECEENSVRANFARTVKDGKTYFIKLISNLLANNAS